MRPEGSSVVRFVLTRDGSLKTAELDKTSGSPILDKQALVIVRGGKYPAFPADSWPGNPEHEFTVTVQFAAP